MATKADRIAALRPARTSAPAKPKRTPKPEGWMAPKAECWEMVEQHLDRGIDRLLLYGIPGTGKTYSALSCTFEGEPVTVEDVFKVDLREDTSAFEIVGATEIVGGDTQWEDGPALLAFNHSWSARVARLVLNEIDFASPDAMHIITAITDDPRTRHILLKGNRRVTSREGHIQILATTNRSREELRFDLGEALDDRFKRKIEVTHPHPDAINSLPEEMRKVAYELSHSGVDESQRVSVRSFRQYAESIEVGIDREMAAEAIFGSRAGELLQAMHVDLVLPVAIPLRRRPKEVTL